MFCMVKEYYVLHKGLLLASAMTHIANICELLAICTTIVHFLQLHLKL